MNRWRKIGFQLKSNLESNWIQTLCFLHLLIHLAKSLKLNETRGAKLRIQLKFGFRLFILHSLNSLGKKFKIKWDMWCKIENIIKI